MEAVCHLRSDSLPRSGRPYQKLGFTAEANEADLRAAVFCDSLASEPVDVCESAVDVFLAGALRTVEHENQMMMIGVALECRARHSAEEQQEAERAQSQTPPFRRRHELRIAP